jgi:anti-sigma regulatory factor (Ser/Thr protein kinase)
MTRVRSRGEDIRKFILSQVEKHPSDISKLTSERFGITRQAVNKHLQKLTAEHALAEAGKTRNRTYGLAPMLEWRRAYKITPDLAEDVVWTNDIRMALDALPDNVMNIWHHGFTEMFNNAIDHSGGSEIVVYLRKTATDSQIVITDDGVGIFKKIQTALNLLDERHAILELSKGKLTTDPKHHSGEGIFFTSRMFDSFEILSGGVYFSHEFGKPEDWLLERANPESGTAVFMKLHNHTARTAKKVFDKYTSGDDFGFNKTVVPVKLAQYGNDKLISRSQAKRLLARIELFKTVMLNFDGVDSIGQAFADEIFRVFATQHPEVELLVMRANSEVKRMISRIRDGSGIATE